MRVNFKEYGASGKKSGTCLKCGKKASRSKKFFQTQSQFNTNGQGEMKSIEEIHKENQERLFAWKEELVYHSKCED